jgi:hypothetical protein
LAVPASELEAVRTPADIGADRRHLAIMLARASTTRVAFEQQAVLSSSAGRRAWC